MKRNEQKTWENILVAGIFSVLIGLLLLFLTTGALRPMGTIVPSVFILLGVAGAVAIFRHACHFKFLFLCSVFVLLGVFLLAFNLGLFGAPLSSLWPVFPLIIGLSLLPPGFFHYKGVRARFLIPAILFIVLSSVFFLFSFRIITISLRSFISFYWPLLFVAIGLGLLVLYLLNRFDIIRRNSRE